MRIYKAFNKLAHSIAQQSVLGHQTRELLPAAK